VLDEMCADDPELRRAVERLLALELTTLRPSIAHAEKSWPPGHPNIAYPVSRLGGILFELGRASEAERLRPTE
jgi:hypothetical protein